MVERRQTAATPSSRNPKQELESNLEIDRDDLDGCLVEQPGFFYHVAEELSAANSRRDTLKLDLEELMAEEDGRFRREAANQQIKFTEATVQNFLRTLDPVKALQRDLLRASTEAANWAALKEAYLQRSFMLRELVALHLAEIHNLGVERGVTASRHMLGEAAQKEAGQARREARGR